IGKLVLGILRVSPFERQELGKLIHLSVEAVEDLVLARDFLAEEVLRQDEHRKQKHDGQEQRRQRVDEAGPVVDRPVPAACASEGHQLSSRCLRESAIFSSVSRKAFWSSAWASTQSRIICCSWRIFFTRPEIPSASDAMAAAVRGLL